MSELLELAARVEALTGPCRQTDSAVSALVRGWPLDTEMRRLYGPAFTGSLDAARSLVPEGCGVTISGYWTAKHAGQVWSAELTTGGIPSKPLQVFDCYDAATPELALVAAALRARAGGGE